jgi:hypothetical protein
MTFSITPLLPGDSEKLLTILSHYYHIIKAWGRAPGPPDWAGAPTSTLAGWIPVHLLKGLLSILSDTSSRTMNTRAVPRSAVWVRGPGWCRTARAARVKRQNRRTGEWFLGCSRYPACRHTQATRRQQRCSHQLPGAPPEFSAPRAAAPSVSVGADRSKGCWPAAHQSVGSRCNG